MERARQNPLGGQRIDKIVMLVLGLILVYWVEQSVQGWREEERIIMVYNNHTNITWCRCERNRMWRRQEFGEVGEERWVIGSMDEEEGKRGVVVMENWMNNVIWQGCVKEDKGFMEGYLGENFEQEEVEGQGGCLKELAVKEELFCGKQNWGEQVSVVDQSSSEGSSEQLQQINDAEQAIKKVQESQLAKTVLTVEEVSNNQQTETYTDNPHNRQLQSNILTEAQVAQTSMTILTPTPTDVNSLEQSSSDNQQHLLTEVHANAYFQLYKSILSQSPQTWSQHQTKINNIVMLIILVMIILWPLIYLVHHIIINRQRQ